MAFTGVAVVKHVTSTLVRITGLSLLGAQAGTIGFGDKTVAADVSLGLLPNWQPSRIDGAIVSLQDAIKVSLRPVTDVDVPVPVSVVKSGTKHEDFAITLTNSGAAENPASPGLEIYVELVGH